jgi:hypothetical protein
VECRFINTTQQLKQFTIVVLVRVIAQLEESFSLEAAQTEQLPPFVGESLLGL